MQSNHFPQGNAFIIGTPKSDRLVQQIGQDQRQKDLFEQQQARLLDQEFSKNVSDIRDIDVGDALQKYQQYKNIGQDLYKNGEKMSNTERVAKQLDKQRAAQQYYSLVNQSKELKAPEDEFQKNYIKNPYSYDENTPNALMQSRGTPVLQHPGLQALVNGVQLKTQDFTKNVASAVGKQTKVGNSVVDNGLTSTPTDYYAYNSPSQFATTLAGSIPDKRSQNKFVNQHSYNDLAAQDLLQKYSQLSQTPEFKKAYPNEPPINPEALNDPFQKAVTLTAIDHILRHPPTAIVGKPYSNTEAVMDRKDATWLTHDAIKFKQQKELAAFNSGLIQGRKSADGTPEGTIGFPTDEINKQYGEDLTLQKNGVKENKRIVRVGNVPSTILETINPIDINKQKYGVDAFDGKDADGKAFKYYEVAPDGLVGKNGKIGRNDAQALYIDKFGNTKVKVAHGNKGLITTPTGGTTKKGKYD